MSRANLLPPDEMTDEVQVAALVELGLFYEHLHREDAALTAYEEALAIEPRNEPALTARGILRYGRSTAASIRDFRAAVSRGVHTVWPFYYMAHHALVTKQYQDCVLYCREGLSQVASDAVRADLLEWRAIARFETSGRIDDVLADFDEASRLAPDNARITRNRTEVTRASWTRSRPSYHGWKSLKSRRESSVDDDWCPRRQSLAETVNRIFHPFVLRFLLSPSFCRSREGCHAIFPRSKTRVERPAGRQGPGLLPAGSNFAGDVYYPHVDQILTCQPWEHGCTRNS